MSHAPRIYRALIAAGLAAVLLVAAVPAQAALAAPAERTATASPLDWLHDVAHRLLAAVAGGSQDGEGDSEEGPGIDPNGASTPSEGEGEGDAGPMIDPDG